MRKNRQSNPNKNYSQGITLIIREKQELILKRKEYLLKSVPTQTLPTQAALVKKLTILPSLHVRPILLKTRQKPLFFHE